MDIYVTKKSSDYLDSQRIFKNWLSSRISIYNPIISFYDSTTQNHIHESQYHSEYQSGPESIEPESWNYSCDQKYHEYVDDERYEPESEYIQWKS